MANVNICISCIIVICLEILIGYIACAIRHRNEVEKMLQEIIEEPKEYYYDYCSGKWFAVKPAQIMAATSIAMTHSHAYKTELKGMLDLLEECDSAE